MSDVALLVDGTITDVSVFLNAIKRTVRVVVYDPFKDTYATLVKKLGPAVKTVGFVYHSDANLPVFNILKKEKIANVADLTTWDTALAFFKSLRMLCGVEQVDFVTCSIASNPMWITAMQKIEAVTGIHCRASKNATGSDGDWIQETDNVDIKGLYFTDKITEYKHSFNYTYNRNPGQEATANTKISRVMISRSCPVDPYNFKLLTPDSKLTAWGYGGGMWSGNRGGDLSPVAGQVSSGIVAIASTQGAYAALKKDGTVVSWGKEGMGGGSDMNAVASQLTGVTHIAASNWSFAALKSDGSVVTWGDAYRGGSPSWGADNGKVDSDIGQYIEGVRPGTVWYGVTKDGLKASVASYLTSGVVAIASTGSAFAALKSDGSVVSWGLCYDGADSPYYTSADYTNINLLTDVVSIASNLDCFAAIKADGSVVAWGYKSVGGSLSYLPYGTVQNVTHIIGNNGGFVALKSDGSIAQWGGIAWGAPSTMTGYVAIASSRDSFAGIRTDGSVVSWGWPTPYFMPGKSQSDLASGVVSIVSSADAFAALKSDGTVVGWSRGSDIGNAGYQPTQPLVNIVAIASNMYAFAAIDASNNAITWGNPYFGGVRTATNVAEINTAMYALAARKKTGEVTMWGPDGDQTIATPQTGTLVTLASNDFSFVSATIQYSSTQQTLLNKVNSASREELRALLRDATSLSNSSLVPLYYVDMLKLIVSRSSIVDTSKLLNTTASFVPVLNNVAVINTSAVTNGSMLYLPVEESDAGLITLQLDGVSYSIQKSTTAVTLTNLSTNVSVTKLNGESFSFGGKTFNIAGFGSVSLIADIVEGSAQLTNVSGEDIKLTVNKPGTYYIKQQVGATVDPINDIILKTVTVPSGVITTFTTITGLNANTEYNIYATAVTTLGEEITSAPVAITGSDSGSSTWYTITDGELTIPDKTLVPSAVTIPSSVTSIAANAFKNTGITSVEFTSPTSLVTIGHDAFSHCASLTSFTIPSTVTTVGANLFDNCTSLSSVTLGSSLSAISDNMFVGCHSLTSVVIPSNITSIGEGSFSGCSGLTTISGLDNITSIGSSAFNGCSGLTSVTLGSSLSTLGVGVFANCASLSTLVVPEDAVLTSFPFATFDNCNSLVSVSIPTIKNIGEYAFSNCQSLPSVTLSSTLESIGNGAFQDCTGLTSITLPSSLLSIGDYAFSSCSGLTSITIPGSITTFGSSIFQNCSGLTSVTLPSTLTSIPEGMFAYCTGLTSFTFPSSVTSIQRNAFAGCSGFTSFTIPSSVTTIGDYVFSGWSSLTSFTIPSTVTTIGQGLFGGCVGLTSITIPSSITSIPDNLFNGCVGLTSITIPSSVTTIGNNVFSGCTGITSITIPSSVTTIGTDLFNGCIGLTSVTFNNQITEIGNNMFMSCTGLAGFTVPSSVTSIGANAFYGCSNMATIIIPESVTSIGDGAFSGCSAITSITFPSSVTSFGANMFSGIPSLSVAFADGTTAITSFMSQNTNITSVTIPSSVTSIADFAFNGCSGLTSITIPSGVTSLPPYIFYGCTGLASVTILGSVTSIGSNAFAYCTALTGITLPSTVTFIDFSAFNTCTSLTGIRIPSGVTDIGSYSFGYCPALSTIYFEGDAPAGINDITDNALTVFYYKASASGWSSVTRPKAAFGNVSLSSTLSNALAIATTPVAFKTALIQNAANYDQSVVSLSNVNLSPFINVTAPGVSAADFADVSVKFVVPSPGDFVSVPALAPGELMYLPNEAGDTVNIIYGGKTYVLTIMYSSFVINGVTYALGSEVLLGTTRMKIVFSGSIGMSSLGDAFTVLNNTITAYSGTSTYVTIPNTVNGEAIVSVAPSTFVDNSTIVDLTIDGPYYTYINNNTFSGMTSLTTLRFKNWVYVGGDNAFSGATSLTSVYFDGPLPVVNDSATPFGTTATAYYYSNITGYTVSTIAGLTAVDLFAPYALLTQASVSTDSVVLTLSASVSGAFEIRSSSDSSVVYTASETSYTSGAPLSVTVSGLSPNTSYSFVAVFPYSSSLTSAALPVTTATDGGVVVVPLTLSLVSWSYTTATVRIDPVDADNIMITDGRGTPYTVTASGTAGTYVVSGLSLGTSYVLTASTAAGSSNGVSVTTNSITLSFTSSSTGSTSANLTVSPSNAVITQVKGADNTIYDFTPSGSTVSVSGLPSNSTTYLILDGTVSGFIVTSTSTPVTTAAADGGGGGGVVPVGPPTVPCFLGSARIQLANGDWRHLDKLAVGDAVMGADGRPKAVTKVGSYLVANPGTSVNPYVIPKGTWGARRQLLISPEHKVAVPGRGMVEARHLGLTQESMTGAFDYYNVEIAGNGNMIVEGVEVESLAPVRRMVMTLAEFTALLRQQYAGRSSAEITAMIQRTCRMLADGRVEVPVMRR